MDLFNELDKTKNVKQGIWGAGPVSRLDAGGPDGAQFQAIWGYACGGNLYMVNLSNLYEPLLHVEAQRLMFQNRPARRQLEEMKLPF